MAVITKPRCFKFTSVSGQRARSKPEPSNQNPWPQYSGHENRIRHNLQGRSLLYGVLDLSTHRSATTFRRGVRK